jgi:hypothetical protein
MISGRSDAINHYTACTFRRARSRTCWNYLFIGVMGVAAALLRTRLKGLVPVPLLLILAAYVAVALFLYWLDRIVLDISYHVFALAFTYWLLGKLRSGVRAHGWTRTNTA